MYAQAVCVNAIFLREHKEKEGQALGHTTLFSAVTNAFIHYACKGVFLVLTRILCLILLTHRPLPSKNRLINVRDGSH